MNQPFVAQFLAVIVVLFVIKAARDEWKKYAVLRHTEKEKDRSGVTGLRDSIDSLRLSIEKLCSINTDEFGKIVTVVSDANAFLSGTTKACESIADATVKHMESVQEFGNILKAPPEKEPAGTLEPTMDESFGARMNEETFVKVLQGLPREEALSRAQVEQEERDAISAVNFGA